ncbi:MAG: hypothetical protein AAGD25_29805 [Cyanobacteria bacterium P01_F01_bin.150]
MAQLALDAEFIRYINYLRGKDGLAELKQSEKVVLSGARECKKYQDLSDEYDVPLPTLRQQGSVLFKWLSTALPGIQVKKANFHEFYDTILQQAQEHFSSTVQVSSQVSGLVPSISEECGFYGRSEELEKLEHLLHYSGAIVILFGMHGVGRRTLISRFLAQSESMFHATQIIWVHPSYSGSMIEQMYTALGIEIEQDFVEALTAKKHLFIFEEGELFRLESQGPDVLRLIQRLGSQAIIISTVPLKLAFATDMSLPGLSVEEAMCIVKEFGLKGLWWKSVVESLGGNPGFIRQYLAWIQNELGVRHKELIQRQTVQYGVVSPYLNNLLDSYSDEELALLSFIAQAEYRSLADILVEYPAHALTVKNLVQCGLVEKRLLATKGRVPTDGRKPMYMVPGVLKKYILTKKVSVSG